MKHSGVQPDGSHYCVCCEYWKNRRWLWRYQGIAVGLGIAAVLVGLSSVLR